MTRLYKYSFLFILFTFSLSSLSQENISGERNITFIVRGSVIESDTHKPIAKVNIEINGGAYTTTDSQGDFIIEVKKGDELVIRHQDFETVYYIIQNNDRIRVKVIPNQTISSISKYKRKDKRLFKSFIDSVDAYLKKDAEKSIQFVTEALEISSSTEQNAEVYEILADVYFEWKQYDLAVANYTISLQNAPSNDVKLKIARAYGYNKNYQEGIAIYNNISQKELSNWQLTIYMKD